MKRKVEVCRRVGNEEMTSERELKASARGVAG
jgi:hypothetical protein